jgi:hypothetical protein
MRSRTPNERGCLGQIQDLRKGGILEFGSVFITASLLPNARGEFFASEVHIGQPVTVPVDVGEVLSHARF